MSWAIAFGAVVMPTYSIEEEAHETAVAIALRDRVTVYVLELREGTWHQLRVLSRPSIVTLPAGTTWGDGPSPRWPPSEEDFVPIKVILRTMGGVDFHEEVEPAGQVIDKDGLRFIRTGQEESGVPVYMHDCPNCRAAKGGLCDEHHEIVERAVSLRKGCRRCDGDTFELQGVNEIACMRCGAVVGVVPCRSWASQKALDLIADRISAYEAVKTDEPEFVASRDPLAPFCWDCHEARGCKNRVDIHLCTGKDGVGSGFQRWLCDVHRGVIVAGGGTIDDVPPYHEEGEQAPGEYPAGPKRMEEQLDMGTPTRDQAVQLARVALLGGGRRIDRHDVAAWAAHASKIVWASQEALERAAAAWARRQPEGVKP